MSDLQLANQAWEFLKKPYSRLVIPDDDGTFRAEMLEFPGCIASGDTAFDALASLEAVAESWLETALENGQHIPEPMDNVDFSGRLVVRLPKSLHRRAAYAAERDGVSLNQFIVSAVAVQVGDSEARHVSATTYMVINTSNFVQNMVTTDYSAVAMKLVTSSTADSSRFFLTDTTKQLNYHG